VTPAGVIAGALTGCILLIWVVNLIRNGRLYVGYGVIFVFGTLAAIAVLVVPRLLEAVSALSVALVPVPSLSIGAIVIMLFLLVYVFTQITVLSNRVMHLTQELAIRGAQRQSRAQPEPGEPR
jgi:hypothetical protein